MSLVPVSRTIKETGTHDQLVDPTSYAVDQTPGESSSVQGVLRLPLSQGVFAFAPADLSSGSLQGQRKNVFRRDGKIPRDQSH